ncbi:MAG: hypothetical protein P8M17_01650 [Saprospiraceae bacterium]|jgi:hypothetical protein|nr:hypothetical protein [Saprospiraceae bacterium]MDB4539417.1 hypothetical protein [Saprospiraceae bacterium]MDB4768802.1 hypothetical protein [Saprospiraceae bacterium]MDG1434573.1 hypothetical protein [Saprospiraceae bacterium]MDG2417667.1 hypothetical protein [Saprospiraceae bacterium]
MKIHVLALCFACFCTVGLFGQKVGHTNAKIEAQKVAYITNRLDLTTEESAVFWPIYNQFQKVKRSINKKHKSKQRVENMSDAELEDQIINSFKKDQELLDLKKEFFEKLKKVLSIRKIATLQLAEREFKTTILDMMKERRKKERLKRRKNIQNGN